MPTDRYDREGNRRIHAFFPGVGEVVRYDREGRWYFEGTGKRQRLSTVQDAVAKALELSERGGTILFKVPGGGRFDYMVNAARDRVHRS